MRNKIIEILTNDVVEWMVPLDDVADKILSLMGENSSGVSDATEAQHGALQPVRECSAPRSTAEAMEHTRPEPLGKITDDGNRSWYCSDEAIGSLPCCHQCFACKSEEFKRSMKSS